ncbi:putative tRNA pseudouridine synthase Pus10 [Astathelohania contejeani]|uniref:tRNA pseudouridine(55) synthase n=1 Tax=Astathelohania contejeani TaxID=164912 RepID=A0ABQ7HZM3_9MICR|nr:putative tRNA pseudouridine synthase Pus10 [Thelohania contejeani]
MDFINISLPSDQEYHKNFWYSIYDSCSERKEKLKRLLPKNSTNDPSTQVKIFVSESGEMKIETVNSSLFIIGKYKKMIRGISQTPMLIGGKRKYEHAVSDFVPGVKQFFRADDVKFCSAGREDADVRMLGGRPFLLEIVNPKLHLEPTAIPILPPNGVEIYDLVLVPGQKAKSVILSGENTSYKTYRALIYMEIIKQIPLMEIKIKQKTPIRVLHRRSNLMRIKEIQILKYKIIKDRFVCLDIRASAGAYIKEFVNGDFGRTRPSLTSILGCYCDLLELDVLKVEIKPIEEELIIKKLVHLTNENI